jgi:hypothetical protein
MTAPCRTCGTSKRHSDRYGCCSGCGRAFIGMTAFDAHWTGTGDDRRCVDPASLTREDGRPVMDSQEVDGGVAWRMYVTPEAREANAARFSGLQPSKDSLADAPGSPMGVTA